MAYEPLIVVASKIPGVFQIKNLISNNYKVTNTSPPENLIAEKEKIYKLKPLG